MSSVDSNDRDWLAMQYVLGELSETERVAFEERLPADVELCEAVIAASRLMLTTQASLATHDVMPSQQVSISVQRESRPKSRRSFLVVAVTSAAMALALFVVMRLPQKSPRPGHDLVSNQNPQAAELVSLWQSGSDANTEEPDDVEDVTDSGTDVAVPSWMLAAISIEASDAMNGPSEKVREN